mgnify:CR=1 FL=1
MNREDVGSWLLGPKATLENQGVDFGYPGARLGLPQSGPGSVASFGRRLGALCIDWFACLAISHAIVRGAAESTRAASLLTLEIFAAQAFLFTVLRGGSFGQSLLGIGIRKVTGERLGVLASLLRTSLLCLVVPALIWDRDGRGLHDLLARSVAIRTSGAKRT